MFCLLCIIDSWAWRPVINEEWKLSVVSDWVISSAVPCGSGAFQMPTCPSSASSSSTLRGGRANLINALVTFFSFLTSKLLWDDINIALKVIFKGQNVKILHFWPFSPKLFSHFFSVMAWTFPRMVLINWSKLDLIESLGSSFFKVRKVLPLLSHFYTYIVHLLKIRLVTFSLFWHETSPGWCYELWRGYLI